MVEIVGALNREMRTMTLRIPHSQFPFGPINRIRGNIDPDKFLIIAG